MTVNKNHIYNVAFTNVTGKIIINKVFVSIVVVPNLINSQCSQLYFRLINL
jgi:hypothetical protein